LLVVWMPAGILVLVLPLVSINTAASVLMHGGWGRVNEFGRGR